MSCLKLLKLTPDRISSKYQKWFLISKFNYHYHCSFQNNSFSLKEKSMVVNQQFSVKKFLDSMISAFQIVSLCFKNTKNTSS